MRRWFCSCLVLASLASAPFARTAPAADRFAHLHGHDPYYVSTDFPRLTTPQWVGEEGVEAVVVLAIDDMNGHEKWEAYLRPILERLKKIDGRAPVSIMTCKIDPQDAHLRTWLREGLSLETHTIDHPCPLLGKGDFAAAKSTFDRCVDLLASVPGSKPVAFRTPCCDSLNTLSPRFFAEIFANRTPKGNFLAIDSSVFSVFTSADPSLPKELILSPDGSERFTRYIPYDRSFVNTVENYPYPYTIGGVCWEFPCVAPSDWSAQHLQKPFHPRTVEDLQAALDLTVAKQGVFDLVFHPHGWIRAEQVIEIIDHAVAKHGNKVKFLTFREAYERLTNNLLLGEPLRSADGGDNGCRLLDLDADGFQDVIVANERRRATRIWSPETGTWIEADFPTPLVTVADDGRRRDLGVEFGALGKDKFPTVIVANENLRSAWSWENGKWISTPAIAAWEELEGEPILASKNGVDQGVRLRDLDHDGCSELLVGGPELQAAFAWDPNAEQWRLLDWTLPPDTAIVDANGRDAGLRYVDIDEDGYDDLIFSNEKVSSLWLFESLEKGWSQKVFAVAQGDPRGAPPITVQGQNFGVWFHSRSLWAQNETTDGLPNLVDRRSFAELLGDMEPGPRSPESSLRALQPRPGFKVELVAAEPLIVDPVAFDWSADGRLWVAEMRDYPLGLDGNGAAGGRIRVLRDNDSDGKYDESTVFLEGLNYPNGVLPWRNGVLITAAPELLYAEDTDGDGVADDRHVLFRGLGQGNQQHRANGLRYGLDNWVYCANGDSGGKVESLATGEIVDIGGRDFRVRPDDGRIETLSGVTQFLRERDDEGNWFGSNNANPMYHFALEDHQASRNPRFAANALRKDVSLAPGAAQVFPLSRSQRRFNDFNAMNRFTSACSAMIYRDNLFGPEFLGNSFVSEPVHNLVHREVVFPDGVSFSSRRADDEKQSEFLASRDNWFRPTMIRSGPDGALWVADMYRKYIEHPEYMPPADREQLDLLAGNDKGRLYRVFPVGRQPEIGPWLEKASLDELISALDAPQSWRRDMAQRLLIWRNDPKTKSRIESRRKEFSPRGRMNAIWTLDGLAKLDDDEIKTALADSTPALARAAIKLATPRLGQSESLASAVAALAADELSATRFQVAIALGEWRSPKAGVALAKLALAAGEDRFAVNAILSSVNEANLSALTATLLGSIDSNADADADAWLPRLADQAVAWDDSESLSKLLSWIAAQPERESGSAQRLAALIGLIDSLQRRGMSLEEFRESAAPELRGPLEALAPMFDSARKTARNGEAPLESRLAAVRLLGLSQSGLPEDADILTEVLAPHEAAALQATAIDALAGAPTPDFRRRLLETWNRLTPEQRSAALDGILAQSDGPQQILDALEAKLIKPAEIDAARRGRLLGSRDDSARAERLLAGAVDKNRQGVVEKYGKSLRGLVGQVEAGQATFKKHCSVCHRLGDMGHAVGPDLAALVDRSQNAMLTAIFDPNRAVESKYISYSAVTNAGLTREGLLTAETASGVTLVGSEGKTATLLRSDLETLAASGKSLMAEGFEKDLNPQAIADLFAFLASHKPPRKTFPGNHPEVVQADGFRGEYWLLASNAEIYGDHLVFEPQYGNLGFWEGADDHAVWTIQIAKAGKFAVSAEYALDGSSVGNSLILDVANASLSAKIPATGNWDTYRVLRLGEVSLEAGEHRVQLRGAAPLAGYLLDLRSVRLQPK